MLEEDSPEEELVVGEGLDRTSCTVLNGESTREEFLPEASHESGKQLPTPPNRAFTFDEELPETSEDVTYETWRKVFRAKVKRMRLRVAAQSPSRRSGYRAEGAEEASNFESHETSTPAAFAWNGSPAESRQATAPTCPPSVFRHQFGFRDPEKLPQFTDHPPVPTLQEDVEMIEEGDDGPDCPVPHLQGPTPGSLMGIGHVNIVPDVDMDCNEMGSLTGIPPPETWIQSSEQMPLPPEPQCARNVLLQQTMSSLAAFPPEALLVNPRKDSPYMDIDVADVEMWIEDREVGIQNASSASGLLQAAPEALWSTEIPSLTSKIDEMPGLPLPVIALHLPQEPVPSPHGLQLHLTESSSSAQMQKLPLIRLDSAPDICYPLGLEQHLQPVLEKCPPLLASNPSREHGGICIPPTTPPPAPASSRQPLDRGVPVRVNAMPADSFDDLPALSFTPSTTGRLASTGPWDLSRLPTPLTSTGPDVSLFPSPGVAPEGNTDSIPDVDAETFLAEAIKGPPVTRQQTGPAVGIDIGFVNLTGDDFASYEDVAGEGDDDYEDSSSDEGWEEIIGPSPLGLDSQQVPLVPTTAVPGEELVITLELEGEEHG
ncbi:hypothetical protein FS837_002635 [Tulasnella sp. UAMH 9824]|nr:hypothetical protein FS837_002635 [Tulasnella sp. UAMH 9824]